MGKASGSTQKRKAARQVDPTSEEEGSDWQPDGQESSGSQSDSESSDGLEGQTRSSSRKKTSAVSSSESDTEEEDEDDSDSDGSSEEAVVKSKPRSARKPAAKPRKRHSSSDSDVSVQKTRPKAKTASKPAPAKRKRSRKGQSSSDDDEAQGSESEEEEDSWVTPVKGKQQSARKPAAKRQSTRKTTPRNGHSSSDSALKGTSKRSGSKPPTKQKRAPKVPQGRAGAAKSRGGSKVGAYLVISESEEEGPAAGRVPRPAARLAGRRGGGEARLERKMATRRGAELTGGAKTQWPSVRPGTRGGSAAAAAGRTQIPGSSSSNSEPSASSSDSDSQAESEPGSYNSEDEEPPAKKTSRHSPKRPPASTSGSKHPRANVAAGGAAKSVQKAGFDAGASRRARAAGKGQEEEEQAEEATGARRPGSVRGQAPVRAMSGQLERDGGQLLDLEDQQMEDGVVQAAPPRTTQKRLRLKVAAPQGEVQPASAQINTITLDDSSSGSLTGSDQALHKRSRRDGESRAKLQAEVMDLKDPPRTTSHRPHRSTAGKGRVTAAAQGTMARLAAKRLAHGEPEGGRPLVRLKPAVAEGQEAGPGGSPVMGDEGLEDEEDPRVKEQRDIDEQIMAEEALDVHGRRVFHRDDDAGQKPIGRAPAGGRTRHQLEDDDEDEEGEEISEQLTDDFIVDDEEMDDADRERVKEVLAQMSGASKTDDLLDHFKLWVHRELLLITGLRTAEDETRLAADDAVLLNAARWHEERLLISQQNTVSSAWVTSANETGLIDKLKTYPGLIIDASPVWMPDLDAGLHAFGLEFTDIHHDRGSPGDDGGGSAKKRRGKGPAFYTQKLGEGDHTLIDSGDKCGLCNRQRGHDLWEVTLTDTPLGQEIGGQESRTHTYHCGGSCLDRFLICHALYVFQRRLVAALRKKLCQHGGAEDGADLAALVTDLMTHERWLLYLFMQWKTLIEAAKTLQVTENRKKRVMQGRKIHDMVLEMHSDPEGREPFLPIELDDEEEGDEHEELEETGCEEAGDEEAGSEEAGDEEAGDEEEGDEGQEDEERDGSEEGGSGDVQADQGGAEEEGPSREDPPSAPPPRRGSTSSAAGEDPSAPFTGGGAGAPRGARGDAAGSKHIPTSSHPQHFTS